MTASRVENRDAKQFDAVRTSVSDERPSDCELGWVDQAANTRRSRLRRLVSRCPLIVSGLLFVAAATGTAGLYFGQYRHDRQTDDVAAKSAVAAASQGTVALLSYAPDKLESDLAAAKSHLTGDFLTYYSKFTDQIVLPAAKAKGVRTTAVVKRAVVDELRADSGKVLVFLDQTTTSKDTPEPVQTASSVIVGLTRIDGVWLISTFDPI